MFDDLFPEEVENSFSRISKDSKIKVILDSTNCASYLEKPELPRNESNFVGLLNQYLLIYRLEEVHVT